MQGAEPHQRDQGKSVEQQEFLILNTDDGIVPIGRDVVPEPFQTPLLQRC